MQSEVLNKNAINVASIADGVPLKNPMIAVLYIGDIRKRATGIAKIDYEQYFKQMREPAAPFRITITINNVVIFDGQLTCNQNMGLSGSFRIEELESFIKIKYCVS